MLDVVPSVCAARGLAFNVAPRSSFVSWLWLQAFPVPLLEPDLDKGVPNVALLQVRPHMDSPGVALSCYSDILVYFCRPTETSDGHACQLFTASTITGCYCLTSLEDSVRKYVRLNSPRACCSHLRANTFCHRVARIYGEYLA